MTFRSSHSGPPGKLNNDALNALRSNPDVESISEDGIMYTKDTVEQ